ncbi:hypothetical protein [Polynucleobacter necessarius]|nr:hypothetical protein [Polynucleobacter necessarius]
MQSPNAAHHRHYLYGILMSGIGSMLFSGKAVLGSWPLVTAQMPRRY